MSKNRKKQPKRGKKKSGVKEPLHGIKTEITRTHVSSNWASFVQLTNSGKKPFKIDKIVGSTVEKPKKERKPADTKVVAIDCEMVSNLKDEDMLARVSVVNFKLECIYDKFVKTSMPVGDYRTRFSGIRPSDVENGEDFLTVQKEVRQLLRNKILVGHALRNDFKVLQFHHHEKLIRDTSKYLPFREESDGKTPSLKLLAKLHLEENIQHGEHSSVEDAKAAMKLYKKVRKEWETSLLTTKSKMKDIEK